MSDDIPVSNEQQTVPKHKKYVFKKRDPVAAAKLEAERLASIKQVWISQRLREDDKYLL
jgi:hypothetical protein